MSIIVKGSSERSGYVSTPLKSFLEYARPVTQIALKQIQEYGSAIGAISGAIAGVLVGYSLGFFPGVFLGAFLGFLVGAVVGGVAGECAKKIETYLFDKS